MQTVNINSDRHGQIDQLRLRMTFLKSHAAPFRKEGDSNWQHIIKSKIFLVDIILERCFNNI